MKYDFIKVFNISHLYNNIFQTSKFIDEQPMAHGVHL